MNGSDEASPPRRRPGLRVPILARDLIFAFFPRGTEGSNPVPSSGESSANLIFGEESHVR